MKIRGWQCWNEGDGGGAGDGKSGGDGQGDGKSTGGDGGKEDVSGLKSALEKTRAENKELRGELGKTKATLDELGKKVGTAEEQAKLLADATSRLKALETKEKRGELLGLAIKKAEGEGLVVDAGKAMRFLELRGGEDVDVAVKEAVEFVGVKRGGADKKTPERAFTGQGVTGAEGGGEKARDLSAAEKAKLFRENPDGYSELRKQAEAKNPFLG